MSEPTPASPAWELRPAPEGLTGGPRLGPADRTVTYRLSDYRDGPQPDVTACRTCGSTLEACYTQLRESGTMCCPSCAVADTHHLIPVNSLGRLDAVEKELAQLASRFDAFVGHEADLPARVDVVERCLADIERILKLRRKNAAAEPPSRKRRSWWSWFQAKRAEKRAQGDTTWPL